jgi:hypothetical protein
VVEDACGRGSRTSTLESMALQEHLTVDLRLAPTTAVSNG